MHGCSRLYFVCRRELALGAWAQCLAMVRCTDSHGRVLPLRGATVRSRRLRCCGVMTMVWCPFIPILAVRCGDEQRGCFPRRKCRNGSWRVNIIVVPSADARRCARSLRIVFSFLSQTFRWFDYVIKNTPWNRKMHNGHKNQKVIADKTVLAGGSTVVGRAPSQTRRCVVCRIHSVQGGFALIGAFLLRTGSAHSFLVGTRSAQFAKLPAPGTVQSVRAYSNVISCSPSL